MHPLRLTIIATLVACGLCSCRKKSEPVIPPAKVPLTVVAERLASSKTRTPEEVKPYDESLTWHEYKVQKVVAGVLASDVIRVAHWTVLRGQAMPVSTRKGEVVTLQLLATEAAPGLRELNHTDDLEIVAEEPPRFLDLSQPLPPKIKAAADRLDYNGNFSAQMQIYWKLRAQLKMIVMGNSHAAKGICGQMFYDPQNTETPMVLNFSPPGSSMEMQSLMLREYVIPLPKIEWVLWVASPRCFNGRREDSRKFIEFQKSPGRKYDVAHWKELWPVPDSRVVKVSDMFGLDISNPWGWEARQKVLLPPDMTEARRELQKENMPPDFELSEKRWDLFRQTLRELNQRNIRVLVVALPVHPLFRDLDVADPDGTTHEGATLLVEKLKTLHAELPLTWFRDFSGVTEQELTPDDFYDPDHLNRDGSRKITEKIVQWMNEVSDAKP